jgi:hypothetical protein
MKNIYITIYSKFYLFAKKINPTNETAAISAAGMISVLPFLNIFIILVGFLKIDFQIFRSIYITLIILFSAFNFYFFILRKVYLKIDSSRYSKKSMIISNSIVISYFIFSFLIFFLAKFITG